MHRCFSIHILVISKIKVLVKTNFHLIIYNNDHDQQIPYALEDLISDTIDPNVNLRINLLIEIILRHF